MPDTPRRSTGATRSTGPTPPALLARVPGFDVWLVLAMVVVVVTCAARYLSRHGLDAGGVTVLAGATVLAVGYGFALRTTVVERVGGGRVAAVLGVAVVWAVLTVAAPSFAWCAVPVAFAVLRALPFAPALGVVVAMTVVVPLAWWRLLPDPDPTVVVGPVALAVVTVVAYRALDQESRARQRVVDELTTARADLAAADRREGALTERARLSREIHDSVGQGLSSITLMLNAADRAWERDGATARQHVTTAADIARGSLDEVRRVVRDLAPSEGAEEALERVLGQAPPGIATQLRIHGDPVTIPPDIGTALTRTAQGALANVVEHSGASTMVVTLTRHRDEVRLDVYDNGRGFVVGDQERRRADRAGRGTGLAGIAARAAELGGSSSVESAPGQGTVVSVWFPLAGSAGQGE